MSLINEIYETDDIKTVIDRALSNIEIIEHDETIGISNILNFKAVHKGFISPTTRMKYSSHSMATYSMRTTDYFYLFAEFIKKYNIKSKDALVTNITAFLNQYLGVDRFDCDQRDYIFFDIPMQTTQTDEELFKKLEQNEIGDLKGRGVAMCTERAAIAQNLLSLFGFKSYFVVGCVNNNSKEEAHAFNIVRGKDNYFLLDYSLPEEYYLNDNKCYIPFKRPIPFDKIDGVLNGGIVLHFDIYKTINENNNLSKELVGKRDYVIGKFELNKDKSK